MRYRRRELRDWDIEADVRQYWDGISDDDKQAALPNVVQHQWEIVQLQLMTMGPPFTAEESIRYPFTNAFIVPHNGAIQGASDPHAEIKGTLLV
jgi:hypothetical protein